MRVQLTDDEDPNHWLKVLDEIDCLGCGWSQIAYADGAYDDTEYFAGIATNKLHLIMLHPQRVKVVDWGPMQLRNIWQYSADDDLLAIVQWFGGRMQRNFSIAYSISRGTARVIDAPDLDGRRLKYCAPLGGLSLVQTNTIKKPDLTISDHEFTIPELMDNLAARSSNLKRDADARENARMEFLVNTDLTEQQRKLREIASTARIEGIGVYEGKSLSQRSNSGGTVTVIVRRSAEPIILVLTSYEDVNWQIVESPGARLRAILMSGQDSSKVMGIDPNIPVYRIGSEINYGETIPKNSQLGINILRWTGRGVDSFQGKYTGNTFLIGGNF
jgi:hypothetical protein